MNCDPIFDTEVLSRVISQSHAMLSQPLADEILGWDFAPKDRLRMEELSAKARAGSLSPNEEAETDSYVLVGHFVNVMQAKARLLVRDQRA
jgi:hypothetical protein